MTGRGKPPSPTLQAVGNAIAQAVRPLVGEDGPFSHSFEVDLDRVHPNPDQPRLRHDEAALLELAASMREHGQLQPIVVRADPHRPGHWIVVAGERRVRAARSLGWDKILAVETRSSPAAVALVENLQRVDLDPIEEARGIARLIEELGVSQRDAARLLGRHESDISRIRRILTLPAEFLDALAACAAPPDRELLVELARLPDGPLKSRLLEAALRGRLTVRALREARDRAEMTVREGAGPNHATLGRRARRLSETLRQLALHRAPLREKDREALRTLRALIDTVLQSTPDPQD